MTEILRDEELTEQLLDNLLEWMTNTNATGELTSVEGICSGRQVAQVLSTLEPQFFYDALADVANIDDDDLPASQKERNHELIARKLNDYFRGRHKDIDSSELWRIVPSEIAITQNREKIVRLIIIVVAVVVFSQHKSYTTSLASNPPELQAQISALVKDFDESTRAITNGDINPNELNKFRVTAERFKARVLELEKENASLAAQNQNLREENEHLEQEVKSVVEEKLRNNEAAQRQRHLETQIGEFAAQMRKAEDRIGEMEAENDQLRTRNEELEQEHEHIMHLQREVREENDAFAQKNAELVREVGRVQKQLEQVSQKESHSARTKNYENELLQKRISSLVQELSQHESIKDQYETLRTLHQNAQRQMDSLKEKLEETTSRANTAETEVMSLKKQLKRLKEQSAAESPANISTASDVPSLHDELNGSMTFQRSDTVESLNFVEVSELRTRIEMLENENSRLTEELDDTRKSLAKAQNATDSKLASQRTQSEHMGQEKDRLQRDIDALKSRDAANTDKIRKLEENLEERNAAVQRLEETLNIARTVIETITSSAGGVPSPVEVMELRNENQQLQQQNEQLSQHLDRFQHHSTQEQRLIATKFATQQLALARYTHGPGFSSSSSDERRRRNNTDAPSTSSASGTPSVAPPDPQFRPPSAASSHGSGQRRSFLTRQFEASNLSDDCRLVAKGRRGTDDASTRTDSHWLRNCLWALVAGFFLWNLIHALYSDEPWTLLGSLPEHLSARLDYAAHPPPV